MANKTFLTFDLKTLATLLVFAFGVGGAWYSTKISLDFVKSELVEIKQTQKDIADKLNALAITDAEYGERLKQNRQAIERFEL